MQLIKNNPYRITGLLVGASAREQDRQLKRLKQYIEAEQEPQEDFSFPVLGTMQRTIDNVTEAASKLNLDNDKMNAALFWFYKGNPITDEPAFDAIKEGDLNQGLSIWLKLTANGEITKRSASAYSNLATLYLSGVLKGTSTNENMLEQGISLKLKFLESAYTKDFKALATDETYRVTKNDLQLLFLNQVQSEIDKNGGVTSSKFFEILNKQEFSAKENFLKEFIRKPIEQIERKIEETKKKQKENKEKAGDSGNELYSSTRNDLVQLKSILQPSDIKLISISDKLANEIIDCSITLFNKFFNTDVEVGEMAFELGKKAKSIALGSVVNERIDKTILVFEKYIKNRPKREKERIVHEELKYIDDKLEKFQTLENSISIALNLANSCKSYLINMKVKLGVNDDLYLTMSTAIASNAQGMIISTVNEAMEKRNAHVNFLNMNDPYNTMSFPGYSIEELKSIISDAWKATITLGSFDMNSKQKINYIKSKDSLKKLYKQVDKNIIFFNDNLIYKWMLWMGGILVFLLIIFVIWGEEGLGNVFSIAAVIGFFTLTGWLRTSR